MANFTMSYFSPSLRFNTTIDVFVPTPSPQEIMTKKNTNYLNKDSKFQVLFLLHDIFKDSTEILNSTNIIEEAQKKKMVVVMPSLGQSFYQSSFEETDYNDFLSRELPSYIQRYFPVSKNKTDTYIGGYGMGGYGAFNIALSNPDTFGYIFSLTGQLQSDNLLDLDYGKNQFVDFDFNKNDGLKIYLNCKSDDPFFNNYITELTQSNYSFTSNYKVDCSSSNTLSKALNWIELDKENNKIGVECG